MAIEATKEWNQNVPGGSDAVWTVTNTGKLKYKTDWMVITRERLLEIHHFLLAKLDWIEEVKKGVETFSRDEKAMFELLQPWQQWAFLVMRYEEDQD